MEYADKYNPIRTANIAAAILEAEQVISILIDAKSEEEIRHGLEIFAQSNGVLMTGYISLLSASIRHAGHYAISTKMDNYTQDYFDLNLVKIDPVFYRGQFENLPIPWGLREQRKALAPGEKPLYSLIDDYQMGCGILVPLHGPKGYSVLGIAINEDEASFSKRMPQFAKIAQLIAAYLHDAVRRVVGVADDATPRLTRREKECLSWVIQGKTAWEISQILHISESTAIFHIENAKKKLESKTLPQAVARGVSLKIITI